MFVDLARVVNAHLSRTTRRNEKRQMRDVSRLVVTSSAVQPGKPYGVDVTVAFVLAPLHLSLGPDVSPGALRSEVPHMDGVRVQAMDGTSRLVVPLTLPHVFVRPMAWDRARGAGET